MFWPHLLSRTIPVSLTACENSEPLSFFRTSVELFEQPKADCICKYHPQLTSTPLSGQCNIPIWHSSIHLLELTDHKEAYKLPRLSTYLSPPKSVTRCRLHTTSTQTMSTLSPALQPTAAAPLLPVFANCFPTSAYPTTPTLTMPTLSTAP